MFFNSSIRYLFPFFSNKSVESTRLNRLQPTLRAVYGAPIRVNSTYCSPAVNKVAVTRSVTEKKITPFVLIGGNSLGGVQVEAGIFAGRWGFTLEAGTDVAGRSWWGGKAGFRF